MPSSFTPELSLPLRTSSAQFHASTDRAGFAERLLELTASPACTRRSPRRRPRPCARAQIHNQKRLVPLSAPAASRVLRGDDLEVWPGETVLIVGTKQVGEEHGFVFTPTLRRALRPARIPRRRDRDSRGACDQRASRIRAGTASSCRQRATLLNRTIADDVRPQPPVHQPRPRPRGRRARGRARASSRALPQRLRDASSGTGAGRSPRAATQRIALARAFLRDAPLVVLDEPTADLDPASAALVAEAIERLRAGRTVLLVAHTPELVAIGQTGSCGSTRPDRGRRTVEAA